jgi:hypothetical protein
MKGVLLALCGATGFSFAQTPEPTLPWRTNGPPLVRIATPGEGQAFLLWHPIQICALSQNFTDAVARVEFFAGTNLLGVVTNKPNFWSGLLFTALREEYACFTWNDAAAGAYTLTAEAIDLAGNSVTSAPVDITVVTNLPPLVSIVKPRNGATILGPTNVTIVASAFDPDGTVASVQFFEGTNSLGVVTNPPPVWVTSLFGVFPIRQTSYSLTWSNVPSGTYSLTAEATDNDGAMTTSQPVDISVVTNLPPRVRLESPYAGATYLAPATVAICAAASDPDGTVVSVEFFAGTNLLGVVTNSTVVGNRECKYDQFCFTWNGVVTGTYTLTAVATDNGGATSTSAPVPITVLPPPPPSVKITSPSDGEVFRAPANIWICSATRHFPDRVASVQYFAGTTSLGILTNGPGFCYHWTNVPPGAYTLTATAIDAAGTNTATSPPVGITIKTNQWPGWRW